MSELVRPVIAGVVVPDDAHHPMVYAGTCLRCGGSEMSPGCASRHLGERVRALRQRGVCDRVCDLLITVDKPEDLRLVEGLTPDRIEELNAVSARQS